MRTVHTAQLLDDLQGVLNRGAQLVEDLGDTELGRQLSGLEADIADLTERARTQVPTLERSAVYVVDRHADSSDPRETLAVLNQRLLSADRHLSRAMDLLSRRRAQIARMVG